MFKISTNDQLHLDISYKKIAYIVRNFVAGEGLDSCADHDGTILGRLNFLEEKFKDYFNDIAPRKCSNCKNLKMVGFFPICQHLEGEHYNQVTKEFCNFHSYEGEVDDPEPTVEISTTDPL